MYIPIYPSISIVILQTNFPLHPSLAPLFDIWWYIDGWLYNIAAGYGTLRQDHCNGCKNTPHRSPTTGCVIDQGLQLLCSEIQNCISAGAMPRMCCSKPMTERDSNIKIRSFLGDMQNCGSGLIHSPLDLSLDYTATQDAPAQLPFLFSFPEVGERHQTSWYPNTSPNLS